MVVSQRCWEWCLPLGDFHPLACMLHYWVPVHYLNFVDLTQTFDSCELPHSHCPHHHRYHLFLATDSCPLGKEFQVALINSYLSNSVTFYTMFHGPGSSMKSWGSEDFPQVLSFGGREGWVGKTLAPPLSLSLKQRFIFLTELFYVMFEQKDPAATMKYLTTLI